MHQPRLGNDENYCSVSFFTTCYSRWKECCKHIYRSPPECTASFCYNMPCKIYDILRHSATFCAILLHFATFCNILRHSATFCDILQQFATLHYHGVLLIWRQMIERVLVTYWRVFCNILRHFDILQHVTTFYDILRHLGAFYNSKPICFDCIVLGAGQPSLKPQCPIRAAKVWISMYIHP